MNNKTIAFIYKWTELSTGKWYIGSHYKKGCHPDDGYICSSKVVIKLITSNPENWKREILEVFDDPAKTLARECEILTSLNARVDPMSYNKTNADGKFSRSGPHTSETIEKMQKNHKDYSGSNNPMYGKPGGMRGKQHSAETKEKISFSNKGRSVTPQTAEKISTSLTGLVWINDGLTSKRVNLTNNSIPNGWCIGLLPEHAKKISASNARELHWGFGTPRPVLTRDKISKSLKGHKDSEATRYKKRQASKNRPLIKCCWCGKLYRSCHRRYHIECEKEEREL